MSTREEWLSAAAQLIYDQLLASIAVVKEGEKWAVSCGFPSRGALAVSQRRVGECWAAEACEDRSTRHIFISPLLREPVDGIGDGVLPTLTHELIHVVSTEPGHRGEFRRIALAVGMEGSMAQTTAGAQLCEKLQAIATQLGPYPHVQLQPRHERRKQSTRMIKLAAVKCCGYTVRGTRKWINEQGLPLCPHKSPMQQV